LPGCTRAAVPRLNGEKNILPGKIQWLQGQKKSHFGAVAFWGLTAKKFNAISRAQAKSHSNQQKKNRKRKSEK